MNVKASIGISTYYANYLEFATQQDGSPYKRGQPGSKMQEVDSSTLSKIFTIADIILVLQILALFGPISLSHSNAYISHSNTWISHSILLFLVPLCMLSSQKIGEQLQDLFASILAFIQKVLFNVKLEAPEKIIIGLIKKKVIKKCSVCVKNGTSQLRSVISLSGLHKLGK